VTKTIFVFRGASIKILQGCHRYGNSHGYGFGFGYLVGRAPKLGHRTDGLWCVNNLPKVVT